MVLVALPTELPLRTGRRIRTFGIQVKREIDIRLSSILYCIQHNTMKPYRSFHQGLFLLFFSFLFRKIVCPNISGQYFSSKNIHFRFDNAKIIHYYAIYLRSKNYFYLFAFFLKPLKSTSGNLNPTYTSGLRFPEGSQERLKH